MLGYLRWLATRRHLPPFVAPLLFSFCPMLMYRWCLAEGHGGDTGVLEEIMGVLYNREKEGVAMVLKNTELVFDTVFRRKVKGDEEGAKREGRDGRMDDERQKMEEGVFDVKKRIEKGPEVKFGYAEAKIIPGMVRVLRETIRGVREEVEGVDVVPMFDLMRKIMGLRLEEVAYSDELTEVRKEVQELCVRFSSDIIRVIRGSFYDMFGILIEEIKWKSDNVAISVAYLDLMSDHFLLFPKAYHISVIFEEPNILFILPKLIVWNEKQSKDATSHGAQKQKKQPQTKLFEEKITFDWVESLSKTNSGQKIVNYRKSMMRYLSIALSSPSLRRQLTPEQTSRLVVFLTHEMFPLQKLILTMDDEEAVLYRDCCYTVSHISMTRDGISLWNYSAVEDAWALANNWKLIRGTNDKAYCEMESWARRVGEGYREKDVLLGKREDVDRYLNNLIKEIKSKVTKRAMLEGDQREEHDENGREEEETGRGDFLTAEENLMHNQKAIKFSSNYTGYDSVERTDGFGAGVFKESGNIGDGFGGGKVVNEKRDEGWTVGVETKKVAVNGHIEKHQENHENHIDHFLTKPIISHQNNLDNEQNSQVFPPQKSILPLFSDSENSEAPEIPEEKPAAQNEALEPTPGSPVPSVSFSDLDKAPSFIFNF